MGYAEFGNLQGFPVFLFHGQPGNRLFRYPDDTTLSSNNIHLITVDRPGFGLSDFQPKRKLLDWPQDVIDLADSLGKENRRVSSRGFAQDSAIMMKDWGFLLQDIPAEVFLWHGELDVNSQPAWGHYLAHEIPNCKATFFADEAHFILFSHWSEILQTLADVSTGMRP